MIGINTIWNMDCLIGMQSIPDKSVDMILCDLPYGTTACKWDVIIPFEPLWEQYERVIKDNGAIVLTASQPFTSALVMSNPRLFKYEWVWSKTKSSNFLQSNFQPRKTHENILVFSKGKASFTATGNPMCYNPIMGDEIKKDKRIFKSSETLTSWQGRMRGDYEIKQTNETGRKFPSSIVHINSDVCKTLHPTQKPVALFEYLIKTYTNEGETVLDNCMGSGTTAIACINTNRNYIGFEIEEKYYNIILDRIKNHTTQMKLAI